MIFTFHFTADDPTEDTVQSRALTMMAVSRYAVKEKKKKERSKRAGADCDEVVTESPQEDTREGMRVPQLFKKELEASVRQKLVRIVCSSFSPYNNL